MTRRISIITTIIGAALALAVPAWGDNWGADQRPTGAGYLNPDAADRAEAARQQMVAAMLDAREQALGVSVAGAKEAASRPEPVRDDRFRIGPTNAPVLVAPSPGTDLEWPQIGIGVGIGIALALGLYLVMRTTRQRPLAH